MLITRMQTLTDSSGITVHTPPLLSHVVLLEFPVCVLQGIVFITALNIQVKKKQTERRKKNRLAEEECTTGFSTFLSLVGIISKNCSGFASIQRYFHRAGTDQTGALRQTDKKSCCHSFAELYGNEW